MIKNKNQAENNNLVNQQIIDRKAALGKLKEAGKKVFLATLPLSMIGGSAKTSVAQLSQLEVAEAFNYILRIEFMQREYYRQALNRNNFIDLEFQDIFTEILNQHQARILLINNFVASLGLNPTPPFAFQFNFSSGAGFNPFNNFDNFLGLAQIIEDLAAGIYKNEAKNIYQNEASNDIKRLVLRLHSTETRHAYFVRFLRAQRGLDNIKGWIDQSDLGTLSNSLANIYTDEANTMQEDIDVPSVTTSGVQAVLEAWDEPIGRGLANSILQLFTRPF